MDFDGIAPSLISSDDEIAIELMGDAERSILATIRILTLGGDMPMPFVGGMGPLFGERLKNVVIALKPAGTQLDGALSTAKSML